MDETREGGCLCGQVRFRTTGAPARMAECHCTDCLKVSGGAAAYLAGFSSAQFERLQGAPSAYSVAGASGKPVNRYFCGACGTPLWSVPEVYPDLIYVKVGAFDAFEGFRPDFAVWTDSAPDWHLIGEGVTRYGKGRT
jgi:hypothetical protein